VTKRRDAHPLLDQLAQLLRELSRLTGGADAEMTASQRIALIEVAAEGPLRLNTLAHRMGTSTPTASRAVDALAEARLVTRTPDAADRRAVRIELTAQGRELLDRRLALAAKVFSPAAEVLSPSDRQKLLELLRRLTEALRARG